MGSHPGVHPEAAKSPSDPNLRAITFSSRGPMDFSCGIERPWTPATLAHQDPTVPDTIRSQARLASVSPCAVTSIC